MTASIILLIGAVIILVVDKVSQSKLTAGQGAAALAFLLAIAEYFAHHS